MQKKYVHLEDEIYEQSIIELGNSYEYIKHEFDDCGLLNQNANRVDTYLIEKSNKIKIDVLDRPYLNAFLSMQIKKNGEKMNEDARVLFKTIDDILKEHKIRVAKANTTFIKEGESFAVLSLAYYDEKSRLKSKSDFVPDSVVVGTIDSYIHKRHFRDFDNDTGFYITSAAVSDIGADGAIPKYLAVQLINPKNPKRVSDLIKGIYNAANFLKIEHLEFKPNEYNNSESAIILTCIGVAKKRLKISGIKPGMKIYVAGKVGVQAFNDYKIDILTLKENLNPEFRENIFKKINKDCCCTNISDGVEKSLYNFLKFNKNVDIMIHTKYLRKASGNEKIKIDEIKYGGDDYALIFATYNQLKMDKITYIGKVLKGNGKIIYK